MNYLAKTLSLLGIGGAVLATSVLADNHDKENPAVSARHHQMQMVAYHTGLLGSVAKGEMAFDAETVSAAARNLASLAAMERATLWTPGTAQGETDGSRAKAEIWSDPDGFGERFEALEQAASALVGASDAAAVGAGMGDLGGACKACHEKYRGPKNE